MASPLAALVMDIESSDDGDGDMRRAARRERARRLRESLASKDDDALADALWPEEEPDDLED